MNYYIFVVITWNSGQTNSYLGIAWTLLNGQISGTRSVQIVWHYIIIMLNTVVVCRGEEYDDGGFLDNAASLQSQVGVLPPLEAWWRHSSLHLGRLFVCSWMAHVYLSENAREEIKVPSTVDVNNTAQLTNRCNMIFSLVQMFRHSH